VRSGEWWLRGYHPGIPHVVLLHRRTLAAPELRLKNDWGFLSQYTTCVREVSCGSMLSFRTRLTVSFPAAFQSEKSFYRVGKRGERARDV
jgi:hypothetical protein